MSIIRNSHGLPRALVESIAPRQTPGERREGADISVTELLSPPRVKQLKDAHHDEIDIDASDRLHALMGSAIHLLIAKTPFTCSSLRLHSQWMGKERNWWVSGEIDLYEDGYIWDFKPIRAAAVFDGPREEWTQQLNVYRIMAEEAGMKVLGLKACPYVRDYTPVERMREPRYPAASMVSMDVPLWTRDQARAFIQYRLTEHEKLMPECTHEERWAKPNQWALMTAASKRAVGLYDTKEKAEIQMLARQQANPGRKFWVVERKAESIRCKYYCDFWRFCDIGREERMK